MSIEVGDKLKDNDPRMSYRDVLIVVEVLPNGVLAEDLSGKKFRYLAKRIHTDGKPRKSGLSLLPKTKEHCE